MALQDGGRRVEREDERPKLERTDGLRPVRMRGSVDELGLGARALDDRPASLFEQTKQRLAHGTNFADVFGIAPQPKRSNSDASAAVDVADDAVIARAAESLLPTRERTRRSYERFRGTQPAHDVEGASEEDDGYDINDLDYETEALLARARAELNESDASPSVVVDDDVYGEIEDGSATETSDDWEDWLYEPVYDQDDS